MQANYEQKLEAKYVNIVFSCSANGDWLATYLPHNAYALV